LRESACKPGESRAEMAPALTMERLCEWLLLLKFMAISV